MRPPDPSSTFAPKPLCCSGPSLTVLLPPLTPSEQLSTPRPPLASAPCLPTPDQTVPDHLRPVPSSLRPVADPSRRAPSPALRSFSVRPHRRAFSSLQDPVPLPASLYRLSQPFPALRAPFHARYGPSPRPSTPSRLPCPLRSRTHPSLAIATAHLCIPLSPCARPVLPLARALPYPCSLSRPALPRTVAAPFILASSVVIASSSPCLPSSTSARSRFLQLCASFKAVSAPTLRLSDPSRSAPPTARPVARHHRKRACEARVNPPRFSPPTVLTAARPPSATLPRPCPRRPAPSPDHLGPRTHPRSPSPPGPATPSAPLSPCPPDATFPSLRARSHRALSREHPGIVVPFDPALPRPQRRRRGGRFRHARTR